MGRRRRESGNHSDATDWASERTLADVEQEQQDQQRAGEQGQGTDTTCGCGASDFLLEAFLHVANGAIDPVPVEVGSLSCPDCGREYEAIRREDGRIVKGDFLGFVEPADDADEDD